MDLDLQITQKHPVDGRKTNYLFIQCHYVRLICDFSQGAVNQVFLEVLLMFLDFFRSNMYMDKISFWYYYTIP